MKKLFALLLSVVMVLSMAACATGDAEVTEPENTTTAASVKDPTSGLEILETVWAMYGEEEKFFPVGGNPEDQKTDGPGAWDMNNAENLQYNLLVPADQIASVTSAASILNMMNANSFTCGVFTVEGDVNAFANTMKEAVSGNQWMCGFPERLVVQIFADKYILVAYGVNDAMTPFTEKLAEAWPGAVTVYDGALG